MPEYCAVICDIRNSRSLANRAQVQRELITSIKEFNESHKDKIFAPFMIIIGDEWQGLLRAKREYPFAVEFFKNKLQLPFYVGVGIGDCIVVDEELTVNQLDGPAFYKARHAIRMAKEFGYSEVVIT